MPMIATGTFRLVLLLRLFQISCTIVIRVNDVGLQEAANRTRQWLTMAGPHLALPDMRQVYVNPFTAGEVIVRNITVDRFVPPQIRFQLNDQSALQMFTHSGYAQVGANWELRSEFLRVLDVPLMGTVRIQMTGLISAIEMKNILPDKLEVSNCVARIRDIRMNLHGSIAADVLQLFRASFVPRIRRKLEQDYCTLMEKFWMPWVEAQVSQFPSNLTFSRSNPEVTLIQSLKEIVLSRKQVDLELRSDLIWNGNLIDSVNASLHSNDSDKPSTRMITIFVEEVTIQKLLNAAHNASLFINTVESPFLQTQCDVLCIGTLMPELSEAMPNSSLVAQVSALTAPLISLYEGQAVVFVNASLNILAQSAINKASGILVSISVDTEFTLELAIHKGRVRGSAKTLRTRAVLIDSQIGMISQKAVDLLVEMSAPFVEDAIRLLLRRGLPTTSLFQFPTRNELLVVEEKFLRLEADIDFPVAYYYSPVAPKIRSSP
uniref:LBP / BPI / CETP family protein n=1 Tax=Haemonchus contortus TaxID=6289 RepID=A0A7I4Z0C1_HAECO